MYIWKFPKIMDPNIDPQNTIVLIIGTPKIPLILGNPIYIYIHVHIL